MVGYDRERGRVNEWAAEVEIVECEPVADGRYYISITGRRRCRVLSSHDQDGYMLSRVRYVKDVLSNVGSNVLLNVGGGSNVLSNVVLQSTL